MAQIALNVRPSKYRCVVCTTIGAVTYNASCILLGQMWMFPIPFGFIICASIAFIGEASGEEFPARPGEELANNRHSRPFLVRGCCQLP